MSLVVWLPLNGNLNNQGLSNVTVINSGATVSTDGKIGKSYAFATSGTYVAVNDIPYSSLSNCTVAFWAKITGMGSSGWLPFTGQTTSYYLLATSAGTGAFYHGNAGSNTKTIYKDGVVSTTPGATGEWHHYCITGVNLSGWTSFYIDKYSSAWNFAGNLNDIRIYDHVLSAREIKELSTALVVHYKLNDEQTETTTNLITTQDCLSSTCYNASVNKYNYGTNTDMYKTTGTFEGKFGTKVYMGTLGNAAYPYVYVSNLYVSDGTNSPAYKTLSFDYFGTIGTAIGPYKLGSGSGTCTWTNDSTATQSGVYTNSGFIPVVPGVWNHITMVLHGTTEADAQWGYIRLGNAAHTSDPANYWIFANMQLELKDHATGYAGVGGTRTLGMMGDVSGYKYNGTITGNLQVTTDTPRYDHAIYFDGASYIKTLPGELSWTNFENLTVAVWMKPTVTPSTYTGGVGITHDSTNVSKAFSISNYAGKFYLNMTNGSSYVNVNSGYTCPLNEWHHYAVVLLGTTLYMYVDGISIKTATIDFGSATVHASPQFQVGVDLPGTDEKYTGYYSDARIYATSLNANDILELYHTSAYVDNAGNFDCREAVEFVTSPRITKTGQAKVNDFLEPSDNIKTLSDGSVWIRLLHHNNPASYLFTSSNAWNYDDKANLYSRLVYLKTPGWENASGEYEFLVCEKLTSDGTESQCRWKQTSNPATSSTLSGYTLISGSPGRSVGLMNKNSNGCMHNGASWWCCCGSWAAYQGGIPGFFGVVTTGYLDLYVRYNGVTASGDDPGITRFYKNAISSNQLLEI